MGNLNNKNKDKLEDTINWNTLKTDNMSSIQYNKNDVLSKDAINLLNNLKLPFMSESSIVNLKEENVDKLINNIVDNNKYKIKSKNINEYSDTSPFISSDVYNYIINNKQKGGKKAKAKAKAKSKKKHTDKTLYKGKDKKSSSSSSSDFSDDTSDTSSSSIEDIISSAANLDSKKKKK